MYGDGLALQRDALALQRYALTMYGDALALQQYALTMYGDALALQQDALWTERPNAPKIFGGAVLSPNIHPTTDTNSPKS
ncbi:hypothetical protein I8752_05590 [Nostocaceae cyanobacterium CENA369]|uniref:Uncharacterized protein n=2 Tax=Dendronalium TaxID=2840442 RepID=A0A8J7LE01_9NOST|nr:hypothetical protein [Dendronalium phyllosphericum CENA369]